MIFPAEVKFIILIPHLMLRNLNNNRQM